MIIRPRLAGVLAWTITSAVLAQAQQAPVFRAGTTVVPVTVTVTDQKGKPVTDLKQGDFSVFESGKAREVVAFFPQTLEPGPVQPISMAIDRRRDNQVAAATRRTFLLVLGYGRIQEPTKALDGLMHFVRERLLPQDAVAVMAFHRATSFTTDHEAIAAILERFKKEGDRLWWDIKEYYVRTRVPPGYASRARVPRPLAVALNIPELAGPPLSPAIQVDIDRSLFEGVVPLTSLRNSDLLLMGMPRGAPTGEQSWQRQTSLKELLDVITDIGTTPMDALMVSQPLKLFAGVEYLRFVDGEKHLVFAGRGPMGPSVPPRGSLPPNIPRLFAARANDARVIVDYVATEGTTGAMFGVCPNCREVAERTGGTYSSLDTMQVALAKIDERSRFAYVLGYTPADSSLDGKYREIRIDVNRRNVTVNYRRGYFASDDAPPLQLREIAAAAAGMHDRDATDIPIEVKTSGVLTRASSGAGRELTVEVRIDMKAIELRSTDGLRTGQLDVTVYCGSANETVVGQAKVRWNLRADPGVYADWLSNGLVRTLKVPVTAAPKSVKVVVYDGEADRTGSKTITLR